MVGFYFFIMPLMSVLCCFWHETARLVVRALPSREEGLCHRFCPEGLHRPPKLPPPLPLPEASRLRGGWPLEDAPGPALEASPGWAGAAPGAGLGSAPGPWAGAGPGRGLLRAGGLLRPAPVPQGRAARRPQRSPGLREAPGRQLCS